MKKRITLIENSLNEDSEMIIWEFSFNMLDRSLTGKNPPDEISVKAKFNESKLLTENIFKIIKIN